MSGCDYCRDTCLVSGLFALLVLGGCSRHEQPAAWKPTSDYAFGKGALKSPEWKRVRGIVADADVFELYSLSPELSSDRSSFHEQKVLGKTTVSPETRRALLEALEEGVNEGGALFFCFEPRHGIRASRGKDTVDLVICFECSHVHVYFGGPGHWSTVTTQSPQKLFDQVLTECNVSLGLRPKE